MFPLFLSRFPIPVVLLLANLMMLFSFLFPAFVALVSAQTTTSTTIGSIAVTPLDYAQYADTIDLQQLRYSPEGRVFFYDKSASKVSNETSTFKGAQISTDGQIFINKGDDEDEHHVDINTVSGRFNATSDPNAANGIFYIQDSTLYFNYHSTFVACKTGTDSSEYDLWWRGASAAAVCEYDWLLVSLSAYATDGGAVSVYKPNNYETSVAQTAVENTATTTATVGATTEQTTDSSANDAAGLPTGGLTVGALAAVVIGYLL
jgi:hypothetical protein